MADSTFNLRFEDNILGLTGGGFRGKPLDSFNFEDYQSATTFYMRWTEIAEIPNHIFTHLLNVEKVSIDAKNLEQFPESFFLLKKLKTLDLRFEKFLDINEVLLKLPLLENLNLRRFGSNKDIIGPLNFFHYQNKIKHLTIRLNFKNLPEDVTYLADLEELIIGSTQWRLKKDIPSLQQLPKLKSLNIENYFGKKWPVEIEKLDQVETLYLNSPIEKKSNHLELVESLSRMKNLKQVELNFPLDGKEVGDAITALSFMEKVKLGGWISSWDHPSALTGAIVKNIDWGNHYQSPYFQGDGSMENFHGIEGIEKFDIEDRKLIFALLFEAEPILKKIIPNVLLTAFEKDTPTNIQLKTKIKGKSTKKIREELKETSFTVNGKETEEDIYVFDSSVPFENLFEWFEEGKRLLPKDHLTELLTMVASPWLMQEENEESNENVYRLFQSNQAENYLIAMQILEGGGANEVLLSMVAAISACHPDKKVARAAQKVYDKFGASTFTARLKKVSLRRSGSSYKKLDALLKTTDVNDMAFRIMHHHIVSANPNVKDVSGNFLHLRKVNCLNPIPKEIRFFTAINGIDASSSKNLDLEKSIDALAEMELLIHLNLSSCHYQIPDEITKLKNLRLLKLTQNEIANPEILAQLFQLVELSVEGCAIKSWEWLSQMSSLRILNIANNKITKIPDEVFNLKNISTLHLNQNKLKTIDPRLLEIQNLHYLNLSSNKITEILYPLFALPSLTYLLLRSNQIEIFDDEKIKHLLTLQSSSLHELSLANNKILSIKFPLFSFNRLKVLDISKNQIRHLDQSIFDGNRIQEFYAQNNEIQSIPETMSDRYFTKVNLAHNEIKELPESFSTARIENLDIRHNNISYISPSFKRKHDRDYSRLYWKLAGNPVAERKYGFNNMIE